MSQPTPHTRFYAVRREGFEWARVWITDDGCLSILSDYGNYGYWWGSPGCEFRRFLCRVDDDYLIRKLSEGRREYDGEATSKATKQKICRLRREGKLTAERARAEWDLLRTHGSLDSEFDLYGWYLETELPHDDECGVGEYRYPTQLTCFVERLWPLFVAKLRFELFRERAHAWFQTRRIPGGARLRVGLRVVLQREALERHGLGHAYDDKVHVVTSLLEWHTTVDLGPQQVAIGYLREAPEGASVTCGQCEQWPNTLGRIQGRSDEWIREQRERLGLEQ